MSRSQAARSGSMAFHALVVGLSRSELQRAVLGSRLTCLAMLGALALPISWSTATQAAELSPAKAAQATFAGASAWAVREDRNLAAFAKAVVLNQFWDTSPSLRANPAAMAAAVQQKWDEDLSRDDAIGRKLERALAGGAQSLGHEAGAMAEKLQEKVAAPVMPPVDAAALDRSGKALKQKRGYLSPVDISLTLESEFGKIAKRATDRRFVEAYNQTVGASLGVKMGMTEVATRQQRPTYQAALESSPQVRAMRNAKGGFTISAAQAVGGIGAQLSTVGGVAARVKANVKVLAPQQGNVIAYMADGALRGAQRATLQAAAVVQRHNLDAARAASHLLNATLAAESPKLAQQIDVLSRSHHRVAESYVGYAGVVADLGKAPNLPPGSAKMASTVLTGQLLGATAELFSLYGNRQAPDQSLVGNLKGLGREIRDIPAEVALQQGHMDRMLGSIHADLGTELQKLELATADIQQKVGEIQSRLYSIEDRISSLERNLIAVMQESSLQVFLVDQDTALGYKTRTNLTMTLPAFDGYQVLFRSWSDQVPCSTLFSAAATAGYGDDALYAQLVEKGYSADENFDFVIKYADTRLGRSGVTEGCAGSGRMPNPNVWMLGANAFIQLARENPWYAARTERNNPQAMSSIIATGTALNVALKSLSSSNPATGRRDILLRSVDAYAASSTALFVELATVGPGGRASPALVRQVTGHQVLLQNLVAFGMPRTLAENDYLNALLVGDQALPSGDEILQQYAGGSALATLQQGTNTRCQALRSELTEAFQALDRGDYAELHSAVESLLKELETRRTVSASLALGDFYTARSGAPLNVPVGGVLANDARPFPADTVNSAIKARLWSGPTQGQLTWPTSRDGSFRYQSAPGYVGQVSFTYKSSDGVVDSLDATVTIRIGNYGDLNGDGVVDSLDLSLLMGLIGKDVDAATLEIADLSADGAIDALDAKALTWICTKPGCAR